MKTQTKMSLLDYLLIEQPNKETQITLGKLNLKHGGNLTIIKREDDTIQVIAPQQKERCDVEQLVYKNFYVVDVYFINTTNGKITNHIVDTKQQNEPDVVLL